MIISKSRTQLEVKPMREYEITQAKLEDIRKGDLVVCRLDYIEDDRLFLSFGKNVFAEMSIFDFSNQTYEKIYKTAKSWIHKKVLGKVVDIREEDDTVILERLSVEDVTLEKIKKDVGIIKYCTVESFYDYGLFVDIGNGIITLIHYTELSKSRWDKFNPDYEKGEELRVAVIGYDSDKKRIIVSRKKVFEGSMNNFTNGKLFIGTCDGWIDNNGDKSDVIGMFISYDPGNVGIMDVPKELKDFVQKGDKVYAMFKKFTDKGFCCKYICKYNKIQQS